MLRFGLSAAAAFLALFPAQGLHSQSSSPGPAFDADAKCVLTFERLGQDLSRDEPNLSEENRSRRNRTRAGLAYFISRLADHLSGSELEGAISASNASLQAGQIADAGVRCSNEYDETMRRIEGELRTASASPAEPVSSPPDHDLLCYAVFSDTGERLLMMPRPLDPDIATLQESLRFGTPFYAARVASRYQAGRLGPALRAAIRNIPEDRVDQVSRECFHAAGPAINRVVAAMEHVLGPNQPGR